MEIKTISFRDYGTLILQNSLGYLDMCSKLTWSFFLHWPIVSFEYTGNLMSDIVEDTLSFRNISLPPSTGSENSAGESRPFSSLTMFIGYDKQ